MTTPFRITPECFCVTFRSMKASLKQDRLEGQTRFEHRPQGGTTFQRGVTAPLEDPEDHPEVKG